MVSGNALNLGMCKHNGYETFAEWTQRSADVPSGYCARYPIEFQDRSQHLCHLPLN